MSFVKTSLYSFSDAAKTGVDKLPANALLVNQSTGKVYQKLSACPNTVTTITDMLANASYYKSITDVAQLVGSDLKVKTLRETVVAMAANVIDLSLGNVFTKTITGATTLTISGVDATVGVTNNFVLKLTNGGAGTITWPGGTKWAGGTAPTLTTSGKDTIIGISYDNGVTGYLS